MKRLSINELVKNINVLEDDAWGFYDWFCREESLERRAKSFVAKLKFLVDEGLLDGDVHYVWFKNNSPLIGSTYDDARISKLDDSNDFVGGICPKDRKGEAFIWLISDENGAETVGNAKSWRELKKLLKTDEALREAVKAKWA